MGCINSSPQNEQLQDEMSTAVGATDDITDVAAEKDITQKYIIGKPLGVGGSCRVVVAHLKGDKSKRVAMKIIDKELPVAEFLYKREVRMLSDLASNNNNVSAAHGHDDENPRIVPIIGHGEDKDSYYIVTKLMEGGEVIDRLLSFKAIQNNADAMTEKKAINLVRQMLLAVKYCHERNIVHRDLKPENFMNATKDPDSPVVLIDFGCAKVVKDDEVFNDIIGTAYFMAPELAIARLEYYRSKGKALPGGLGNAYKASDRTGKILRATDIWALGVIAYILVTGHRPFRGHNNLAIFASIVKDKLLFPRSDGRYHTELILNPQFIDFTQKLMTKDPLKRPTIDECINHPWVRASENESHQEYQLNADVLKFLKQFKQQTRLKKEVTRLIAKDLNSEATSKNIRAHFARLDNDGDGLLNQYEITILLLDMGYNKYEANKQAQAIIEAGDKDKNGFLDFQEFTESWYRKVLLKSNDAIIQSIFDIFDTNGDGYIDAQELNDVLFNKGDRQDGYEVLKGSDADVNATDNDQKELEARYASDNEKEKETDELLKHSKTLISDVDADGDGRISFEEFKQAMKEDIEQNGFDLKSLSYGDMVGVKYDKDYDFEVKYSDDS